MRADLEELGHTMDIKESDWKVFKKVRELALERYCQRVITDVRQVVERDQESYHQRYLKLWKLIGDRDEALGIAFDDPRRSQMIVQLANIDAENLLTEDELNQFSHGLLETLQGIRRVRDL